MIINYMQCDATLLPARLLAGVHGDVLVRASRRHCRPKTPTTRIQINMAIAISCDCQPCRHLVLTMLVVRLNMMALVIIMPVWVMTAMLQMSRNAEWPEVCCRRCHDNTSPINKIVYNTTQNTRFSKSVDIEPISARYRGDIGRQPKGPPPKVLLGKF